MKEANRERDRVRNETEGTSHSRCLIFRKTERRNRSHLGLAREKGRRSSLLWTKNNESFGLRREKTRERETTEEAAIRQAKHGKSFVLFSVSGWVVG